MNKLLSKFNLKQKFIIIFLVFSLFTLYQIFSDTINEYYIEKKHYNQQIDTLFFIKKLTIYFHKLHSYKQSKQIELKKELQEIMESHKNKDFKLYSSQLDILFDSNVNNHNLLSEKLLLLINFHSNILHINAPQSEVTLKTVINDIPFIIHNLHNPNLSQHIKNTNKTIKNLINMNLFISKKTQEKRKISIDMMNTFIITNKLFSILEQDIINTHNTQNFNYMAKLIIELVITLLTFILIVYVYKSLYTYIRKIQNAHKVKSIFLSNMSHELRTPLNAIIGFLNILKESKNEQEQKKFIEIIYKSSKQLLYIINDILDFSKIEDAKLKIEKKPLNIKNELELLIELFSANASSKNIKLKIEIDENLPLCILSDKFRIKQIVSNLLSNAIKFTKEGGTVTLRAIVKKKQLQISVEDNGIGINKKVQKDIFKSFLQAKNSISRQYGGTGLGLSISSKLVSLLGSKLKVESQENKGSRFYFNLKINKCKEKSDLIQQEESRSTYNGNVLLVEDNPTNQFLMQITFTNLKLNVTVANDGVEAIEKFKNEQFNIIFMDDNMPNKSGVEAAKEIVQYEKEKELKHTPMVALTATTSSDTKKKFFDAGMDEYMAKPFDIKLLHKILQKYLIS